MTGIYFLVRWHDSDGFLLGLWNLMYHHKSESVCLYAITMQDRKDMTAREKSISGPKIYGDVKIETKCL